MKPQNDSKLVRLIAFYLPQFHPIPENDKWWGKGFTEWTNVAKAKPLFQGHYQPRIPADLGFYDLRVTETRIAQAEMARKYGIDGFCYWHYWFGKGKRLLKRPFNEVLESKKPDFPFCLAWANETWSRRWLGEERDILQKQTYSDEGDLNHIRWLIKAFSDHRYIRIKDRPLFMIYRPWDLPDPNKTTDVFRSECIRLGVPEPYLIGISTSGFVRDARKIGFDGTMKFTPSLSCLPYYMNDRGTIAKLVSNLRWNTVSSKLKIYDYAEAYSKMTAIKADFSYYSSIFVDWDNTPRRGRNAIIIINSSPDKFGSYLVDLIHEARKKPEEDRIVFINAWNEWAEGNYLEPDMKFGSRYLEAVKQAISDGESNSKLAAIPRIISR